MKLRIYPKKDIVVGLLNERIAAQEENIKSAEAHVASLEAAEKVLVTDPFGTKLGNAKLAVEAYRSGIKAIRDQVLLVESHGPSEVMLEIEV